MDTRTVHHPCELRFCYVSSHPERNRPLQEVLRAHSQALHLVPPDGLPVTGRREDYDAVIVDALATGARSFELCRRLRIDGERAPIIVVWKDRSEFDRAVAQEFGATDLIAPPFDEGKVVKRILGVLLPPERAGTEFLHAARTAANNRLVHRPGRAVTTGTFLLGTQKEVRYAVP